jgi:hypothetical protein
MTDLLCVVDIMESLVAGTENVGAPQEQMNVIQENMWAIPGNDGF